MGSGVDCEMRASTPGVLPPEGRLAMGDMTMNMITRILMLAFLAAAITVVIPADSFAVFEGTLNIRVSSGDDDAEECVAGGANAGDVEPDSSDLEMVDDSGGHGCNQIIGLRFQNVGIPAGSEITRAYIEFTHDDGAGRENDDTTLTIKGEDIDDAPAFEDSDDSAANDNNISNRTTTTASVTWDIGRSSWRDSRQYTSDDIKTIVQEIVDRGDGSNPGNWQSGNDMVFIISGSGLRTADSYNGSSANAPLLHVEYTSTVIDQYVSASSDDAEEEDGGTMGSLNSTDLDMFNDANQVVGVRFRNVPVPRGKIITNAYIEFTAKESRSGTASLKFEVEAADDGTTFSNTNADISGRTKTGGSVEWTGMTNWTAGSTYQSPDLSSLIQDLVGRTGWNENDNAMVFIITTNGSGRRDAATYDHGTYAAPKLHVEYSDATQPFISVSDSSIGVTTDQGTNPAASTFALTNVGAGSLAYTITDDVAWLSVSPSSGTLSEGASATITVTFSTSSLAVGTHVANITITDTNAINNPVEVGLSVTVSALPAAATCGNVPVYTENLVSPAILILLDRSGSMSTDMPVTNPETDPKTPDLTSIVQHIVGDGDDLTTTDREDWTSGNAMVFIIEGTSNSKRVAVAYDGSAATAPLLHVEYTSGGSSGTFEARIAESSDDAEEDVNDGDMELTSSDLEMVEESTRQIVGLRFQNVTIPKDATITAAYLQFVVDESDSVASTLTIYGQDASNPPTFASTNDDISDRTKTSQSVTWNSASSPALGSWSAATMQSRMEIAKDAISDLVEDRGISWGFGTWTGSYDSSIDYTKVHVGCKTHDDSQQSDLQTAISGVSTGGNTPLTPQLDAAEKYFLGTKKDNDGSGDYFDTTVSCQPLFLITVTDGLGNTGTTNDNWKTSTTSLLNNDITPIAVGFGIDDATQLNDIAAISNAMGGASDTDDIYALHNESGGVGVPFIANNKQELVDALSTVTESVKAAVFHGAAPAPTTSADLGDTVIVASFDASDWTGDVKAVTKDSDGDFTVTSWTASNKMPSIRSVFTVNPSSTSAVVDYTDSVLTGDNFACYNSAIGKPLGDIINSTPLVVGGPSYFYTFDGYEDWKLDVINPDNGTDADGDGSTDATDTVAVTRETMVYIGANDGALHAFRLSDGVEKWAFIPYALQSKLSQAAGDDVYDRCDSDYCHQYYVDGTPVAGDIFDGTNWKTMLVTGLGEGGAAYFALDVTSSETFDHGVGDQVAYMWEFTDTELGLTQGEASIDRVVDSTSTAWAVFFGSGYATTNQSNKAAYLFGIKASDKSALWSDGSSGTTSKVLVNTDSYLSYKEESVDFTAGETLTGATSSATAVIESVKAATDTTGTLRLTSVSGTFQDGETISGSVAGAAKVDGTLSTGRLDNALSSPLVADLGEVVVSGTDAKPDYKADHIYTGDLYGTMYRVTSIGKGQVPSVGKLFDFEPFETSTEAHPIRAKAEFAYRSSQGEIWVYFGTGRYEEQVDKTTTGQQYFFGLKDDLNATSTYKYDTTAAKLKFSTSEISPLTAEIVSVTVAVPDGSGGTTNVTKKVRRITGTSAVDTPFAVKLSTTAGQGSERVIAKPLVVSGVVFFTTFIPDQDVCAGNGDSYVFGLNYKTGAAPTDPVFDINEDGVVDENDKVEDPNNPGTYFVPSGISLADDDSGTSPGQASHPVLHRDSLFVTTTGEGLKEEKVNLEGIQVQLGSWKEKF